MNQSDYERREGEGLLGIRTFVIQPRVVSDTIVFLQEVGRHGYEGFVIWTGRFEKQDRFRFHSTLIPEQRAMITASGLLVAVDGHSLFKMNKTAYERGEILAGQVHTHPTSAYHSSTDDHYPLVTLLGALSIVVPNFAKDAPGDMASWAWYRLADCGLWESLTETTEVVIE